MDQRRFGLQVAAGAEPNAFEVPLLLVTAAADSVALATGFGSLDVVRPCRVENRGIWFLGPMQRVAALGVEVLLDVFFGRAMAGFAGNAQFGDAGIEDFRLRILERLADTYLLDTLLVDAAGSPTVREVAGPDPLKEAARQTVASWSFRRSTPERMFLAATFTYKGDTASVEVRPQE